MQLSLPVPIFPTAAVSPTGTGNNPTTSGDPAANSGEPFDFFLVQDAPAEKPAADKPSAEAENAAAIMAAAFWMPITPAVTPPVGPTPSLTAGPTVTAESNDTVANGTGDASALIPSCFGSTSSRSFAAVRPNMVGATFQKGMAADATTVPASGVIAPENTALVSSATPPAPVTAAGVVTNSTAVPKKQENAAAPLDAQFQSQGGLPGGQNKVWRGVSQAATSVNVSAKGRAPVVENLTGITTSPDATATDADVSTPPVSAKETEGKFTSSEVATDADGLPLLTPDAVKEKIASLPPGLNDAPKNAAEAREKYFVEPVQKAVTAVSTTVGIAVAKLNSIMSAAATNRPKSSSLPESTAAFVYSSETAPVATLTIDAPAPVATVRETLAAVISAVDALERRADIQHKSVDLQFSVGSEKLGLRVELRDGTVHTTFLTESSQMNSALAREWHSVVQPVATRELRIADPVFNSSTSGANDSPANLMGHGSPQQQREQQKAAPFASALKREFYDSGISESAPAVSPASNSSKLLNALA